MYISKDEFLQMQQARQERAMNASAQNNSRVSYFSLKDDGDEAIVRFAYSTPDELWNDVITVHNVTIDGKFRKVNCLRSLKDPVDNCPLCASGQNFTRRQFIRLVEYVRNDDGSITPTPKIWDRPASYNQILTNLFTEYGPLTDVVFKIKRSGVKGDTNTTYTILFGNPSIYNEQLYTKDFGAFDNYKVLGTVVLDKNFNEVAELVGDAAEVEKHKQTFTPQSQTFNTTPQSPTQPKITY